MACRWCKGTGKITLARTIVDCKECEPQFHGETEKTFDKIMPFIPVIKKMEWPKNSDPFIHGHFHKVASGSGGSSFVAKKMGWFNKAAYENSGYCLYEGPDGPLQITEVTDLISNAVRRAGTTCVGVVGDFISRHNSRGVS